MSIIIRPYRDADWPRLCAIHDAARQTELALAGLLDAFLPLEIAAQREGLFSYTLRVAELDGQAAGFAAFTNDELAWLYVDPALARRGVGRALVALYEGCGFHRRKNLSGRMPGNEAFPVTVHVLELDRAGLG